MFGRKQKYYKTAMRIVHEYFEIETDRELNPRFPGYSVYMDVLSEAYHIGRLTVEEAAISLVIGYWAGISERATSEEEKAEARLLGLRILEFTKSSEASGKFGRARASLVRKQVREFSETYGI